MIRVLLATPVKGGFDSHYLQGIVSTLMAGHAGVEYVPMVSESTYVNYARNSIADAARRNNCDEVIFIDSDMQFSAHMVERLRSHDVDIVCGRYCKRKDGKPEWLYNPMPGAVADANGLLEIAEGPTGFMRIRTKVFDTLFQHSLDRLYTDVPHKGEVRCEYFPIGIIGGGMEGRLDRLRQIVQPDGSLRGSFQDIYDALYGKIPAGWIQGEDYQFCRIARQHGFRVYLDTQLTVRHLGILPLPRDEYRRPYEDGEAVAA